MKKKVKAAKYTKAVVVFTEQFQQKKVVNMPVVTVKIYVVLCSKVCQNH
jgi:hypothetical protein